MDGMFLLSCSDQSSYFVNRIRKLDLALNLPNPIDIPIWLHVNLPKVVWDSNLPLANGTASLGSLASILVHGFRRDFTTATIPCPFIFLHQRARGKVGVNLEISY